MTIISRLVGFYFKLPSVQTRKVLVEEDIQVPTKNGIQLLTDHYRPKDTEKAPLILVRTPYGRKGYFGLFYGRLVAERGYQVIIQSCRGTFGSGGEFFPYKYEKEDGLATVEWMRSQEWYPGSFATIGGSYMGFTQWAIANEVGPELQAITPAITATEFHSMAYPQGSFSFQSRLDWVISIATQEESGRFGKSNNDKKLQQAYQHLPLVEIPEKFFNKKIPFWELFLDQEKNYEFWESVGVHKDLTKMSKPVAMSTGWYDIFLPWQLKDYQTLCENGNQPYLTIGPWAHSQMGGLFSSLKESLAWFEKHLKQKPEKVRKTPVNLFIMGANVWREFEEYPPANTEIKEWFLQPNNKISLYKSDDSEPDTYVYNPSDPTPNVGGTLLMKDAGPKDNKLLESRSDVLVYSSSIIDKPIEVIGPVMAVLYVKSSLEYTDFFVRLCDVDKKGKSLNICDGIIRLSPKVVNEIKDDIKMITINLWPTAYQFKAGHKIRVQISSGAHPRFLRNLGVADPISTATQLKQAHQSVYHDKLHSSHIKLNYLKT